MTGYQPYQLMFGHKARIPCDNWLGLSQYDINQTASKNSWIQEYYDMTQYNDRKLKHIKQRTSNSAKSLEGQSLPIPQDNLVFLQDHPKGYNKIQDKFKSEQLVLYDFILTLMCTALDK